jgi:hypothetical protein
MGIVRTCGNTDSLADCAGRRVDPCQRAGLIDDEPNTARADRDTPSAAAGPTAKTADMRFAARSTLASDGGAAHRGIHRLPKPVASPAHGSPGSATVAAGVSSPIARDGGKPAPWDIASKNPAEPIKIANEVIATPAAGK